MNTKFLVTILLAAFACTAGAQQGKVGIIDLRKVFDDYHKTKTADARLKDQAADLDKERKVMMEQYQKAADDYKAALDGANDQAVSADERENARRPPSQNCWTSKIGNGHRAVRSPGSSTLEEEQRKLRDRILGEIRGIINTKAKAAGYTLVVDSAAETVNKTPVVMYTNGENDLTAAVLADLNANAPASPGAASGAKPPASNK
jgi:Skp family chaperone for outer membrane proteins